MANDPLRDAARALMEAVENDENQHGGTLNRETLRLASLLRIELNRKPAAPRVVAYAVVTQFNTLRIWWSLKPPGERDLAFGERFVTLIEGPEEAHVS